MSSAMDETEINREFVASNLNRAVTLIGSTLAIFTFVLFFLYPRYIANQLNSVLFQVTLTTTLLSIFLFGFAGVNYFEALGAPKASIARKKILIQRGNTMFVLALLLGTAMPALILFTINILMVATIATALWALYAGFIVQQGRKLRIS